MPKTFKEHEDFLNYYRKYRAEHRNKLRKYNRVYNKQWRKKYGYESNKAYELRYPEKHRAHKILHNAIKTGLIEKENCKKCGSTKSQAHHPDYSKPLQVIWLCPLHHAEVHRTAKMKKYRQKLGIVA